MNFEQAMAHLQRLNRETLAVMAKIESRPANPPMPHGWTGKSKERWELHERWMNHIRLTLAEIDEKLRRLRDL